MFGHILFSIYITIIFGENMFTTQKPISNSVFYIRIYKGSQAPINKKNHILLKKVFHRINLPNIPILEIRQRCLYGNAVVQQQQRQ